MKNRSITSSIPSRARIVTITVAGLIGLFALAVDLAWPADAATGGEEKGTPTDVTTSVNLDSLYALKASEETAADSTALEVISPEKSIEGHVSWYGSRFHGRKTANGERFDMHQMTAAHKSLPFNTIVRVVDQRTGHAVLVRINDRGPYVGGRVLDLSKEAAGRLGIMGRGTTNGMLEIYDAHDTTLASSMTLSYLTFDKDVKGVEPQGWSVEVMSNGDFESAQELHNLLAERYGNVFLSRYVVNGAERWTVTVGLYSNEHLAADLQLDLSHQYNWSRIVRFEGGIPDYLTTTSDITDADTAAL